ncbi:MAG: AbrB/MazE/SpoVT family DNA-binding domain-containing protein [Thermoplasmata archaeon]|nr:AbrB/MazE/SpoVT family DNA-binding domain-containing protein [Thermoplasmata archaeon]
MELLGSSKVTNNYRMQLIKAVRDEIGAREGDIVLFYRKGDDIILKKG